MSEYGPLDRVLHRIALQSASLAELSFDLDQLSRKTDPDEIRQGRHIFVSGLARAGTTILMRRIFSSGYFCSLTYRNMPFVLAPNLWGRKMAYPRAKSAPTERAHGDRILVDIDSPEGLDEVFWRVFDAQSYLTQSFLTPHVPEESIARKYAAYVAAILGADPNRRTRYLSKNNNSILRLNAIGRTFPKALILIPFREPLSHASSLLRQHRNFVAQQKADPFVQLYMTWLGHHEFGLDHRPFRFDDVGFEALRDYQPECLDYWLHIWNMTYSWLEENAPKNALFVCYEDLCRDPAVWDRLKEICGLESSEEGGEQFVASVRADENLSARPELTRNAKALYDRLVGRARNQLMPA